MSRLSSLNLKNGGESGRKAGVNLSCTRCEGRRLCDESRTNKDVFTTGKGSADSLVTSHGNHFPVRTSLGRTSKKADVVLLQQRADDDRPAVCACTGRTFRDWRSKQAASMKLIGWSKKRKQTRQLRQPVSEATQLVRA